MVILVTALFTASSIGFALLAQELWSSNAKITKGQPQNLAAYQQQVKQFQPIFDIYQEDGTVLVSRELDGLVDPKVLFQRFMNTFNSADNKRDFLGNSAAFQEFKNSMLVDSSDMTPDEVRILYAKWFDSISASKVDKKDLNSPYTISFQTTTKESSFDLLTAYILTTELKAREDAFNNLRAIVNSKHNELIQQKRILESQASTKLLVETERTKYAAQIAKSAGVDRPIQTGNESELFSIDLGAKGLDAKVKALESVKNLSVIEPRLQQINAKLDMLKNLEIDYVRTAPLAEPAVKAVEDGQIQFVPKQYENMYFAWMRDVQDWCISRQLWWGHRIPAWYDNDGKVYVGRTEEEVREKNNLSPVIVLKQDNDVLDTWFSSALWTFGTQGWPEDTEAMKTFHPSEVLVSGFDIIFFWVARMIMMTMHFVKDEDGKAQVPFKTVYMTAGPVKDAAALCAQTKKGRAPPEKTDNFNPSLR